LAFLHGEPEKIEVGKTDTEPTRAAKLKAFRDRLATGRLVRSWHTIDELCKTVLISIGHESKRRPGIGWVRGDQAIDPRVHQEIERLTIENLNLRTRLQEVTGAAKQLRPKLLVVYDPTIQPCKDVVNYLGGSARAVCFRLQVTNLSINEVKNCEGWLTKIEEMPQLSPTKLFWIGIPAERMSENVPSGSIPRYLQVCEISDANKVTVSMEGRLWPLGDTNIFRPGQYNFEIKIVANGVTPVARRLRLNWTGNWQTAEMQDVTG
jgi:hypothetical protein